MLPNKLRHAGPTGIAMILLVLTACGGSQPQATGSALNTPPPSAVTANPTGDQGNNPAADQAPPAANPATTTQGMQVNVYLWRATLDVLSFMPIESADPFGGVVVTDWYSPPATPNERFRANAYISSPQMRADAVQVTLFHQVLQNGAWVDTGVDPGTVSGLEDRILARAADLRAATTNAKE